MIGKIIDAIMKECQAIPGYQVGTVMRKTDYRADKIGSYDMPMMLIAYMEADDSGQLIGGLTRMDYTIGLNSYCLAPDPMGDDTTGETPDLSNVIDIPRRHFSKGNAANFIKPTGTLIVGKNYMVIANPITYNEQVLQPGTSFTAIDGFTTFATTAGGYVVNGGWLTYGMWEILNDYGFRFTLGGLQAADALDGDGLVMGYRVLFETISFDRDTINIAPSKEILTTVKQVGNPPY